MNNCQKCNSEYDKASRIGKIGRVSVCEECAEEEGDETLLTGVMIYSHKGGASIQINSDPELTAHINETTKLRNKGSNLGSNLKASARGMNKTKGGCYKTADAFNYKNRTE